MQSIENARRKLLSALPSLPSERTPIEQAAGRILAIPLIAPGPLPAFSNSSMDGFAVRSADIAGAGERTPVALKVIGDIPAGSSPGLIIGPGEAVRIMTGGPMPQGADAVVPVEGSDFDDRSPGSQAPDTVKVYNAVGKGAYVRRRGEDIASGTEVLPAGIRLRPQDVGMAAMAGASALETVAAPRVAVLSTGDELLEPGAALTPGAIYESNSLVIASLLEQMGANPLRLGIAPDSADAVQEKLDRAVAMQADLIISSAGVSVGAYDYVKSVVEAYGRLDLWRVNMRPGKPLAFGSYRGVPFVGLPGNPVSSFVGFEVFLRPALAHMAGWTTWSRESRTAILEEDVSSDGRESYLRAVVRREGGLEVASLTGHQGSGNQFSLVQANALVVIPAGVTRVAAGERVDFWGLS